MGDSAAVCSVSSEVVLDESRTTDVTMTTDDSLRALVEIPQVSVLRVTVRTSVNLSRKWLTSSSR